MSVSILVKIKDSWQQTAKAYSVERYRNHIGQTSYKPLSANHEYIGLLGEVAFSHAYALPLTWENLNGGGDSYDFSIGSITIDVKTYRRPISVLCKQHKKHAERIVLAKYIDDSSIKLIGWDYYDIIKRSQPKDFGRGIINHHKEAGELRDMKELEADIEREKQDLCQSQSRYIVHTRN